MKSLKNGGAGTLEMKENVPLTITSNYFFKDNNYKSYKYTILYSSKNDVPISLTLNGDLLITLELGDNFIDPLVTTNYIDYLSILITLNNQVVNSVNCLGKYTITYTVTTDTDTKSITRTVIVNDTVAPTIRLNGHDHYVALAYNEMGVSYYDLSECKFYIKYYQNGQ